MPVRTPDDVDGAFALMVRERVTGFLAVPSPLLRSQRAVVVELSLKHRLAGMFGPKDNGEAGGLMSSFSDVDDVTRRGATYIDKILKGARPADLPVEQASKYELVINLKTPGRSGSRSRHQCSSGRIRFSRDRYVSVPAGHDLSELLARRRTRSSSDRVCALRYDDREGAEVGSARGADRRARWTDSASSAT